MLALFFFSFSLLRGSVVLGFFVTVDALARYRSGRCRSGLFRSGARFALARFMLWRLVLPPLHALFATAGLEPGT